jgi:hypothetical protein
MRRERERDCKVRSCERTRPVAAAKKCKRRAQRNSTEIRLKVYATGHVLRFTSQLAQSIWSNETDLEPVR